MAAATQVRLGDLANELAIGIEDVDFADHFVGSVLAHRDGDILLFSHDDIVVHRAELSGDDVAFG